MPNAKPNHAIHTTSNIACCVPIITPSNSRPILPSLPRTSPPSSYNLLAHCLEPHPTGSPPIPLCLSSHLSILTPHLREWPSFPRPHHLYPRLRATVVFQEGGSLP